MIKKLFAEALGSCFLAAVVVGSGIMAQRLSQGNNAVALLGNTLATAAALCVLIVTLGSISGAQFNPAVSLVMWLEKRQSFFTSLFYSAIQIAAMIGGVFLAHAMFGEPILQTSNHIRGSTGELLSEGVATFWLVFTILATLKFRETMLPATVPLAITAGYWFTASTSFANPAITIARSMTNSFAGIAPQDVLAFVVCQFIGAVLAWITCKWLLR